MKKREGNTGNELIQKTYPGIKTQIIDGASYYIIEKEQLDEHEWIIRHVINSHRLFNQLNTIKAYAVIEPEKVPDLIDDISLFFRTSARLSKHEKNVPFIYEMELVDSVLAISKARFPNLKVEKDLQEMQFLIPPFAVAEIVENAIRFGKIRNNREAEQGKLVIKSYFDAVENEYVVEIANTGDGFDWDRCVNEDSGLWFVQKRLERMGHGRIRNYEKDGMCVLEMRIAEA